MRPAFLLSFLANFLFCCSSKAQESEYLIRYEESDQSGYKTPDGEVVIPAGKYAMCFTDTFRTYAVVVGEGATFIGIDRSGKELYEVFAYDNGPDEPSEGLFRIVKNGKIGFADAKTGAVRIAPEFLCADRFRYGIAAVSYDCRVTKEGEYTSYTSGNWSYIDPNGKPVATTKGKTYAKEVIDNHVSQLNKLLKANKLKKVDYPNMSGCGGGVHGYYQGNKLQYIDAFYGAEFGGRGQKVWLKDSSVIKIVLTSVQADYAAYEKKYPGKDFDDKGMTYHTSTTTIWLTEPIKVVMSPPAAKEEIVSPEELEQELRCIEEMMIELWSTPYIIEEMKWQKE